LILSLQAFAPAALLLAGGLVLLLRPSATIFVVVQALTLVALLRLSQLASVAITVPVYDPVVDAPLLLRLDRLSLFFATAGVAAALLVALPWVGGRGSRVPFGWIGLGQFGAVAAILAGNLQGLAAGWGIAAGALLMLVVMPSAPGRDLRRPSQAATRNLVLQLGGAILLLAGAVGVEAIAGTASYDAVPIGAVDSRTGLLLAAAPILALAGLAGLIRLCRTAAAAALFLTGVTLPMSVYVLARTFDLAGGHPLAGPVPALLVLAAGIGASLSATFALWAPDLGSTISRLLNSLGFTLVAAFGLGGATGLTALLVGFMSIQVVAGATLVMADAGGGRLAARGPVSGWLLGVAALVPLAALAGLAAGLALDTRLLVLRQLVEAGPGGILLGLPLLVAVLVGLVASWGAGRFGGGTVAGHRGVIEVGLAAAAVLAIEAAGPILRDLAVSLAAASARTPLPDLRSSVNSAVPGTLLGLTFELLLLGVITTLVTRRATYSADEGLRRVPDMLPPRIAVVPEIALTGLIRAGHRRALAFAAELGPAARFAVLAAAWGAALLAVVLVGR
jgi:hypothetical protein